MKPKRYAVFIFCDFALFFHFEHPYEMFLLYQFGALHIDIVIMDFDAVHQTIVSQNLPLRINRHTFAAALVLTTQSAIQTSNTSVLLILHGAVLSEQHN